MMDAILDAVFYGALGVLASFMMDVVLDAVFFFFHLQLCMMMTVIPHTDCCSNESSTRGQSCRIYYTRKGEPFFELVGGLARAHPSDEFSSQHPSKPKATMALNPFLIVFFGDKKRLSSKSFFLLSH
jgi:hypothetical protein